MRLMRFRALVPLLPILVAVVSLAPAARAQPPDVKAAAEPALRQLDAFRRNDYDTAYTLASREIHRLFDRQAFERMVRAGYPEIADSLRAHVASTRVAPNGTVYLILKVRGANGQRIEALYEMVREFGSYKINGVVARPDPGEDA
jgi:hypothetical protein